ncbi:MAG: hypothetical protein MUF83_20305 [Acidimicrobiales bacterium]|nr:hypothetical protein [Acidimicrobiales bacterium]
MDGIAPLDVAVVDADLLWRVDHMNALKGLNVQDFGSVGDAVDDLSVEYPSVLLIGPNTAAEVAPLLAEVRAARPRAEPVCIVDGGDPELRSLLTDAGVRTLPAAEDGRDAAVALVLDLLGAVTTESPAGTIAVRPATPEPGDGRSTPAHRARIVVVTGAKAGEGASTVAINLAATLAASGDERVTLVDADGSLGDTALYLGLPPPSRAGAGTPGLDDDGIGAPSVDHEPTGLRVVLPSAEETETPRMTSERLLSILVALEDRTDIVVVDAPLEVMLAANLEAYARAVLVVSSARTASLKNTLIAQHLIGDAATVSLLLNAVQSKLDRSAIEHAVGLPIVGVLPFDHQLERQATFAEPSMLAPSRSHFKVELLTLADRLYETSLRD